MKNPGWIDLQVNGHNGVYFSSPDLTADEVVRAVEQLAAAGTAKFLPTICTSPVEVFRRNSELIRSTVERHGLSEIVPGLHFEGPLISNRPGAVGAHNAAWTLPATAENVDRLFEASAGFLKILTLSADAPGAADAIRRGAELGIHMSVGHHLADYEQVHRAADAGAELLTHLGNGCPNEMDRHVNPVWAGLAEERLTAMLIADGHHLPGELLKVLIRAKGVEHVIITSDASSATGFVPGTYQVMGLEAVLTPDGKLFNPERRCLVGSASTIGRCMAFLESLGFLSEEELTAVGRDNPLKMLK